MSDYGWIRLHRQIQKHWMWQEKPFQKATAWIDLLLLANHEERKIPIDGKPVLISKGSFHTSIAKLSDRWGWDKRTVSRFLNVLENDGMLSQVRSERGTTLTIINYGFYQGDSTAKCTADSTAECTAECTADGTAECTQTINIKNNKNVKKDKNVNNNIPPLSPQGDKKKTAQAILKERNFSQPVEDVVEQWLKYKIEKHQPYKETGLNQLLNKIERWANDYGDAKVVEVITRTMASNYQGIVEEWFRENRQQTTQTRQTENFYDRLRKAVNEC